MAAGSRVPLLLLGTYHMDNPHRDLYNPRADDVLSDARQRQIQAVVTALGRFRPTDVALEVPPEELASWNQDFQRYCQGRLALTANERHQLGFRLAAACGLSGVHAVDWNEEVPYLDTDLAALMTYAEEHHPDLFRALSGVWRDFVREFERRQATDTVSGLLRWLNDPVRLALDHQNYLALAALGVGRAWPAVPWLTSWFQRNLIIFVNLTRLVASPADRLLVVYGSGHIPLLRQLALDSGLFSLENPHDYLPEG